ncbi:hypothetical protein SAMN06265371_102267 [Lutibacter agarilyticus]|uniref:HTH luxR-type domain-containing protein n=1 Tax=Lutibacter agarilyticus TaxID=1109740 RepID=A0A238VZ88_9FLAO|nr:hypothetical protein [Lutibacter agarilyticus]SNR39576.1 hypothetical protein SAMN06265371_102267 [Lutibacter agarilyticus]
MVCSSLFAIPSQDTIQNSHSNHLLDSLFISTENKLIEAKNLTDSADYPNAYDNLWIVLNVADSIKNPSLKYKAYKQLSMLYSIFHNYEKAYSCVDSMFYYANKTKELSVKAKGNLHFSAAITYRMQKKYDEAASQLKICEQLFDSLNNPIDQKLYILTEKAHLNTLQGNYKKAEELLIDITKQTPSNHSYVSILYSMWGDFYSEMNNKNKALEYYNKSLIAISKQNTRIGLRVELLSKASKLNYSLGNNKIAFEQMEASKQLGDSLFGSQSIRNKQLFEIKDSYREIKLENQRIQKQQELENLKSEEEKLNLQLGFSIALLITLIIAAIVVVTSLKKKYQLEKKLITERTRSEVEMKKKELTLTALQLMEKDRLLDEIKTDLEKIQQDKGDASIHKIRNTINVNSKKNWEEFEARFVQINNLFYDSLYKKHSDLSRNELKLCALIKLNFSSKEMAQILGVSADSINKARYRLRKKMNLTRDENLVTYINTI